MSMMKIPQSGGVIEYPESDGKPMAENTKQWEAIALLKLNLEAVFRDEEVFVASDLFWYPVEGMPTINQAPDTMVAFGRPKGDRGSYKQWEEAGIAPQVVFEVLSPGNRPAEMKRKLAFYERYGVEEYYIQDPDKDTWEGYIREEVGLVKIASMEGWKSEHLGITFEKLDGTWVVKRPNGEIFRSYEEIENEKNLAVAKLQDAEKRAQRMAAKLRELGLDPEK